VRIVTLLGAWIFQEYRMHSFGRIVIIKKNGEDGRCYHLKQKLCTIGRNPNCNIRMNIEGVAEHHAWIIVDSHRQVWLKKLSNTHTIYLNNRPVTSQPEKLSHSDLIYIANRAFRFEDDAFLAKTSQNSPLSPPLTRSHPSMDSVTENTGISVATITPLETSTSVKLVDSTKRTVDEVAVDEVPSPKRHKLETTLPPCDASVRGPLNNQQQTVETSSLPKEDQTVSKVEKKKKKEKEEGTSCLRIRR